MLCNVKILKCARRVTKDIITDDLVQYIEKDFKMELATKMLEIISSGDGYIVRLGPMTMFNNLIELEAMYQQELTITRFILCKDCAKRKKNKFCLEHMCYEEDYDFCSKGEQKERSE